MTARIGTTLAPLKQRLGPESPSSRPADEQKLPTMLLATLPCFGWIGWHRPYRRVVSAFAGQIGLRRLETVAVSMAARNGCQHDLND